MGGMNLLRRQYDKAITAGRKSLKLGPNMADLKADMAYTTYTVGDWDETILLLKSAIRLSPRVPTWYLVLLSRAYVYAGHSDLAIATAKSGLAQLQSVRLKAGLHRTLAFAHVEAGRTEKARQHVAEALKLNPRVSTVTVLRRYLLFKNPADVERQVAAMRKAGMPE